MYTVLINKSKYVAEEGTPLREILSEYGVYFPCGGAGRCGKCQIVCPALPVTDRDRRFLSANQLAGGVRLACDKKILSDLSVECTLDGKKKERRALDVPSLAVSIEDDIIEVGILDDELAETATFINPLQAYGSFSQKIEAYEKDRSGISKSLRAVIGKAGVEFFEEYGKAKAETVAISAKETYLKMLIGVPLSQKIDDYNAFIGEDCLSLPTESIYFLPSAGDLIGGDILCETAHLPENTVVVDCGDNVVMVTIDKETSTACSLWDMDYSPLSKLAFHAALRVMRAEGTTPLIYLYGKHAYEVEDIFAEEGLTYIHSEKDFSAVAKACVSARFRSRLEKEKQRLSIKQLLKDEDFQDQMVLLSQGEP